jgi:ABC-type phosphate/phosphonate transport system substrate-binding protein
MAANKQGFASLPMYDWPEIQDATDAFWATVREQLEAEGIYAAEHLLRGGNDSAFWLSSDLLLGQSCGYPLATSLKGKVRYVTTPIYDVVGCEGAQYSSAIVVKRDSNIGLSSLAGRTFAYNSKSSLSGYQGIRAMFGDPETYFANTLTSGSHRKSARMLANGGAEVAAIDAVCWHMLRQYEPETTSRLWVIGWTNKCPALPMITSLETSDEILGLLRKTLTKVSQMPEARALSITGFEEIPVSEYYALSSM